MNVKTYRGLRRRGEQRHGAGVLRPLLRPLSIRGHGCFAERQYDYKQRQTQPARKKVVKEQGAEEQERSAGRSEIFLFKSETRHVFGLFVNTRPTTDRPSLCHFYSYRFDRRARAAP